MNITSSLGTHFSDGLRAGPIYDNNLSGPTANINGVITSNNYSNYGPGILFSAQNSWNITPAAPGVGFTVLNNVVATTAPGTVGNNTYLTLTGDNSATFYTSTQNGVPLPTPHIQFDWPRVVTVTTEGGAGIAVPTNVTIFGFDWWGYPLQMTYVLPVIADAGPNTYPVENIVAGTLVPNAKAFYQVTGVFVEQALPAGVTISVGASAIFGLPYYVSGLGVVSSISWGKNDTVAATGAFSEFTIKTLDNPLDVIGVFVPGDTTNPATATTGDPRGLYSPSSFPDNLKTLIFTSYIAGADTWINQVNNGQTNYMIANNVTTPQGVAIAPLNTIDLEGVPQFYTGVPA